MNLAIWDIESSSASTDFGSIIEIGGVLVDENFKEKDRFNLRCRLPEGEIFHAMALIVNKTSIKQLTQTNLCLLYTSPSPRDVGISRMPSSA